MTSEATRRWRKTARGKASLKAGKEKFKANHPYYFRDQLRVSRKKKPWLHILVGIRSRSKKTGRTCDLTKEWAAERYTGRCELTGIEFSSDFRDTTKSGAGPFSPSVDRVDRLKGYTKDNCRFVLQCVNMFRFTMNDAAMMYVAKALLKGHAE